MIKKLFDVYPAFLFYAVRYSVVVICIFVLVFYFSTFYTCTPRNKNIDKSSTQSTITININNNPIVVDLNILSVKITKEKGVQIIYTETEKLIHTIPITDVKTVEFHR